MILKRINLLLKDALNRKKLKISHLETQSFSSEEARNFLFFQFNFGNAKYFFYNNNKMNVHISEIPHYSVVKQSISSDKKGIEEAKKNYIEYLKSSWPSYGLDTSQTKLDSKYQKYLEYIDTISRSGEINSPVLLTQIPGKQGLYVVDGNHRCSVASALGFSVPAKILNFQLAFDQFMRVDEFYGTKNRNMPYQSIYINRKIIRNGRREDIYHRLNLLPHDLLKQKTILDVGCNIGMNSIGAFKSGARKVVGLEASKKMVNFATRFSIFDDCYPDVEFRQFDVDQDMLPNNEKYDVAFMMSILKHLKNPHALAEIARKNVMESVIFEGHPDTKMSDYAEFLDAGEFSKTFKVSDLATSAFDSTPTRPLWILYK